MRLRITINTETHYFQQEARTRAPKPQQGRRAAKRPKAGGPRTRTGTRRPANPARRRTPLKPTNRNRDHKSRPTTERTAPNPADTARRETPPARNPDRPPRPPAPAPPTGRRTRRDRSRTPTRKTPQRRERPRERTHPRPPRNRPPPNDRTPTQTPPPRPRGAERPEQADAHPKTRPRPPNKPRHPPTARKPTGRPPRPPAAGGCPLTQPDGVHAGNAGVESVIPPNSREWERSAWRGGRMEGVSEAC